MATNKCRVCNNEFYTKPSHIKKGWGIYCSRGCKHIGTRIRKLINCFVCNKVVSKTSSQIDRVRSGKFFCGKSCQTKWRNRLYSGHRHLGWRGGQSLYRKKMLNNGIEAMCALCHKKDLRILAVHHIDRNHLNLDASNLTWLCQNCHFLVHHDKLETQRFLSVLKPKH